jgi:hypothetical protein
MKLLRTILVRTFEHLAADLQPEPKLTPWPVGVGLATTILGAIGLGLVRHKVGEVERHVDGHEVAIGSLEKGQKTVLDMLKRWEMEIPDGFLRRFHEAEGAAVVVKRVEERLAGVEALPTDGERFRDFVRRAPHALYSVLTAPLSQDAVFRVHRGSRIGGWWQEAETVGETCSPCRPPSAVALGREIDPAAATEQLRQLGDFLGERYPHQDRADETIAEMAIRLLGALPHEAPDVVYIRVMVEPPDVQLGQYRVSQRGCVARVDAQPGPDAFVMAPIVGNHPRTRNGMAAWTAGLIVREFPIVLAGKVAAVSGAAP